MNDLAKADAAYEAAEAAYLEAVRVDANRLELAALAEAVAVAADAFNSEAYREFHNAPGDQREDLNDLTERTEVLSELWADLAAAYKG